MSNNKYSFQITFDPFQNGGIYYYKIAIAIILLHHIWYEDNLQKYPTRYGIYKFYSSFKMVAIYLISR